MPWIQHWLLLQSPAVYALSLESSLHQSTVLSGGNSCLSLVTSGSTACLSDSISCEICFTIFVVPIFARIGIRANIWCVVVQIEIAAGNNHVPVTCCRAFEPPQSLGTPVALQGDDEELNRARWQTTCSTSAGISCWILMVLRLRSDGRSRSALYKRPAPRSDTRLLRQVRLQWLI